MTDPQRDEGPELVDPAAKTQPAEGGRDEVEESLEDDTRSREDDDPTAGG
jgi:hypothetical protein